MKKNFLKTIVGAVFVVSTLAVLPQIWVSAHGSGTGKSTRELTAGKGAGGSTFHFAQGNGCESVE